MLSFIIDYGLFLFLLHIFKINYAISAAISFTIAVVVNWYLNAHWVFDQRKVSHSGLEMLIFIILALVGLGVNELVLWIGVERLSIGAEISKIYANIVVACWSFITRKLFLYH